MLYVNEIMKLSLFDDFKLIAGKKGLNRNLNSIVILEYESIIDTFDVFNSGNFVLTSLFFAKDNEALITEALSQLIKINVAGIAIKTIFFHTLPEEIIALANAKNIPIFTFANAYMEDLIICVNELLKDKQQYLLMEEHINHLLNTTPSEYVIEKTAYEINPKFCPNIISAYITKKTAPSSDSITSFFNRLMYKKYQHSAPNNYSYVKYKAGMLLLYSYTPENPPIHFQEVFYKLLKDIDINPELFYMGVSNASHSLKSFNTCIQESIQANKVCRFQNRSFLTYSLTGIYRYIFPLLNDPSFNKLYDLVIATLLEYDEQFSSNLLETLIIYVRHNGEIASTAKELFQHPNTIRYRINKSKDLLQEYIDESHFYEEICLIIHAYLLNN